MECNVDFVTVDGLPQILMHRGDHHLTIKVHSANCRCVDLTINNDLSIAMQVPVGMNKAMILHYVELNEDRIFHEYEKKMVRNHQALPITLDLVDGKIVYRSGLKLPLLGRMALTLRIKYQETYGGTGIYVEKNPEGGENLVIRTDNDDPAFIRYCVMRYYRRCAEQIVRRKVREFADMFQLEYNHVRITGKMLKSPIRAPRLMYRNIEIKNQTTLWGSCNKKKNLKFDWKLAMLPREVIDYIIVHELTHLKKMNHSKAFWAEVEKVMPEYQECGNWLTKHGKEYEIF